MRSKKMSLWERCPSPPFCPKVKLLRESNCSKSILEHAVHKPSFLSRFLASTMVMSPPSKLPSISKSLRFATPRSDLGNLSFCSGLAFPGGLVVEVESADPHFPNGFRLPVFVLPPSLGLWDCAGGSGGGNGEERKVSSRGVADFSKKGNDDPSGL
ncbi:hypothetical protein B0O99DRAFT_617407 [Bisporella sp. PMI_857]|nr:hypothetical protein B0O99DRAFT_617407 [Bisporella sp. PMI_857]